MTSMDRCCYANISHFVSLYVACLEGIWIKSGQFFFLSTKVKNGLTNVLIPLAYIKYYYQKFIVQVVISHLDLYLK